MMMNIDNEINILKEEHIWTSDEKIKWMGYGEWVEEADVLEIEYQGYSAYVIRVFKREPYAKKEAYFGGHLCGYVKIPEGHPFFKGEKKSEDLYCHGGITFNEDHVIGFDCGHSGDYVPTMEHMRRTRPELIELRKMFPPPKGCENYALFNPSYKNIAFCIEECKSLIDQLIEAAANLNEKKI